MSCGMRDKTIAMNTSDGIAVSCVYQISDSAWTRRTDGISSRPDEGSAQADSRRPGFALQVESKAGSRNPDPTTTDQCASPAGTGADVPPRLHQRDLRRQNHSVPANSELRQLPSLAISPRPKSRINCTPVCTENLNSEPLLRHNQLFSCGSLTTLGLKKPRHVRAASPILS